MITIRIQMKNLLLKGRLLMSNRMTLRDAKKPNVLSAKKCEYPTG